jgi:hypothetical protein
MPRSVRPLRDTIVCATLALLFHPGLGEAEGLTVPAPRGAPLQVLFVDPAGTCGGRTPCFTEIQAGIDAAAGGDAVVVGPGTYVENINFGGKDISVVAERGPLATVIDGGAADAVVTFASGEGPSSALIGFTVQNGFADQGGGISIDHASPTLLANIIARNRSCNGGGGIGIFFGSPLIAWNRIVGNLQGGCPFGIGGGGISARTASEPAILGNVISANSAGDGGGISLFDTRTPIIFNNLIDLNTASSTGGAISIRNVSSADIVQNLIVFNGAPRGGGIAAQATLGAADVLASNTIAYNASPQGSGFYIDGLFMAETTLVNNLIVGAAGQAAVFCAALSTDSPVFRSNDVVSRGGLAYAGTCTDQTGASGNISADPKFVSARRRDFRLRLGSPAIDAGDSATPQLSPTDFEGRARIVGPRIDMGAYESQIGAGSPPSTGRGARSNTVQRLLDRARAIYEHGMRAVATEPAPDR